MRCRWLLVATSLVALNAASACESERSLGDDLLRVDAGASPPSLAGAAGQLADDASAPPPQTMVDSGAPDEPAPDASMPPACEQASAAFRDYVAANRSCAVSSDCSVIGDCGPNADFVAVQVGAAAAGYELMAQRCPGIFDGPTFEAVCEDGQCVLGAENGCCGCPADDAGGG